MANVEGIKKELEDSKQEYNRYTKKLERLEQLKRRQICEYYNGEKDDLEKQNNKLEEKRDRWEAQVQILQKTYIGLSEISKVSGK